MVLEALTPAIIPGGLGPPELVVILLIFVLLFGANRIPELARSTGEAMGEFQKGRQEVEEELQEMQDEVTPETDGDDFVDTEPVTEETTEESTSSEQ